VTMVRSNDMRKLRRRDDSRPGLVGTCSLQRCRLSRSRGRRLQARASSVDRGFVEAVSMRRGTKYVAVIRVENPIQDGRPAGQWMMRGNWMRPERRCVTAISGRPRNLAAFTNSRLLPCDRELRFGRRALQESWARLKPAPL
jgi:hypothetical protein